MEEETVPPILKLIKLKTMYSKKQYQKTSIKAMNSIEGETIEQKIRRIVNNKEPITDGAPLIFTERKEGVQPAYDIRTDKWEVAVDAMDKVSQAQQAQRSERQKEREESKKRADQAKEGMKKEGESPAE